MLLLEDGTTRRVHAFEIFKDQLSLVTSSVINGSLATSCLGQAVGLVDAVQDLQVAFLRFTCGCSALH